jgi:glycosyltransferase involved in cell wall biosynthesis
MKKSKVIFISESIRRDSHAPLRYFKNVKVLHFYLNAPYKDMAEEDLKGARQVDIRDLEKEIIKEDPDFIQGAEPFGSRLSLKLAYISYRASLKSKAKLVIPILENRPLSERFSALQRAVLRAFCPKYFDHASAVLILNNGAEKNVKAYAPKAKIIRGIIWGVWGVDTDLFKPIGQKIDGQIIYAGRWVEEKGLKYMLEGFQKAHEQILGLKLNLFGHGSYEEEMRKFTKENGLTDHIKFMGQVKNVDLPRHFSESELCIYPSITQRRWEEQVGTVNFQAMACGTPVLTTRSGAIPEYIKDGEGAILVDEKNSEQISEAIVRFFEDASFKKKMQKEAREYIMRFDAKEEVEKAEKLLLKLKNEK